jgi:hypothetical protein
VATRVNTLKLEDRVRLITDAGRASDGRLPGVSRGRVRPFGRWLATRTILA